MNQQKTGAFLRELRQQKNLTQEQLAQQLGVTNRSVSRWETGATMPDFDILLELANAYGISLDELMAGQRRTDAPAPADQAHLDALRQAAEYQSQDTVRLTHRLNGIFLVGIIAFAWYAVMDMWGDVNASGWYEDLASAALGIVLGVLLVGFLFTSRYLVKVRAFQARLWKDRRPSCPPGHKEK